ncbi:hypothetical protein MMC26_004355 [Xylographa opegraphella]|nr:hypothetical protein [Xylographa opegraphella]
MSWMDSWSRPTKHSATPPPLYLTSQGETVPYCHTCGRVIPTRKAQSNAATNTVVKYCSDRCRHQKIRPLDRKIEDAFVALLNGLTATSIHDTDTTSSTIPAEAVATKAKGVKAKKKKGDPRITVACSEVETAVFGSRHDPEKVFGRKKNRARRGAAEAGDWKSIDMEEAEVDGENQGSADDSDDTHEANEAIQPLKGDVNADYSNFGGGKIRPPQSQAEVNGSVGGEKGRAERGEETVEMLEKRKAGERRADEKEMVRRAARRGCAFGFVDGMAVEAVPKKKKKQTTDAPEAAISEQGKERRRKCEAVMNGVAVEASFAKGDWAIRWREGDVGGENDVD